MSDPLPPSSFQTFSLVNDSISSHQRLPLRPTTAVNLASSQTCDPAAVLLRRSTPLPDRCQGDSDTAATAAPDLSRVSDNDNGSADEESNSNRTTAQTGQAIKKRKRSPTAETFDLDDSGTKWICRLCQQQGLVTEINVGIDKSSTTGRLRHLRDVHPDTIGQKKQQSAGAQSQYTEFQQSEMLRRLTRFLVSCDQPFSLIEDPDFRELLNYCAQQELALPRAHTARNLIASDHGRVKQQIVSLLAGLPGRVSFTLDAWTSQQMVGVLGITAHFITADWKLYDVVIAARHVPGSHTGLNMANIFLRVLEEFGISGKVFCLTTDNASNMSALARAVSRSIPAFAVEQHIPCLGHILNLAVQDGLKRLGIKPSPNASIGLETNAPVVFSRDMTASAELQPDLLESLDPLLVSASGSSQPSQPSQLSQLSQPSQPSQPLQSQSPIAAPPESAACTHIADNAADPDADLDCSVRFGSLLSRLRTIVRAIRSSEQRRQLYRHFCTVRELDTNMVQLDCPTRWNSTLAMIKSARGKAEVLNAMAGMDGIKTSKISEEEWQLLESFELAIEPLQEVTVRLSGSQYPTASFAMLMYDSLVKTFEELIVADHTFDFLRDSLPMLPAAHSDVRDALSTISAKLNAYHDKLREKDPLVVASFLDPRYKAHIRESTLEHQSMVRATVLSALRRHQQDGTVPPPQAPPPAAPERTMSRFEKHVMRRIGHRATSSNADDKVDRYIADGNVPGLEDDPLMWWKTYGEANFGRLAAMARTYLAVPATSTPAERLFSSGRLITHYTRCKLSAESLGMLMELRNWYRNGF